MKKRIELFIGPVDEDNVAAYDALERIPEAEVIVVTGCHNLVKYVPMPYIDTYGFKGVLEGMRFYGLLSIGRFLESLKSHRACA
ncbi:MAG: hypothetical protein HY435_03420 [Candidatus Liptonbacteria bacterium]|nr:hypothetical protein [Candidatus Liptonbacteria bacterium]